MSTIRERLAARLNVLLPVLGYTGDAAVTVLPEELHVAHVGHWQRSEGAFSWFLARTVELGSQNTMLDCVRYPVTVSTLVTSRVLDPVKPGDPGGIVVPPGGMFAVWTHEWLPMQWYDAAGNRIADEKRSGV